jgi:TPR repeat protein
LGYAEAQSNLGIAYAFGKGVLKDDKQSVYWYQKAADQGNAEAQSNLGIAYAF